MKKMIGIPLMFLFAIMLAGLVSAATFVTPPAAGEMRGDYELNVSVSMFNVENCTVTGTSAATGDTFTVNLYNQTEYTGAGNVNGTLDTASQIDASDWSFTGSCLNTSGTSESITTRGSLIIDNTEPVCTLTSSQTSSNEYLPTATWTATCTSATSATIAFDGNTYDMTESSDVCSFSKTIPEGLYDVVITTNDGLNTTQCTELNDVRIKYDGNSQFGSAIASSAAGKKTASSIEEQAAKAKQKNIAILIILVVVVFVLWKRNN